MFKYKIIYAVIDNADLDAEIHSKIDAYSMIATDVEIHYNVIAGLMILTMRTNKILSADELIIAEESTDLDRQTEINILEMKINDQTVDLPV